MRWDKDQSMRDGRMVYRLPMRGITNFDTRQMALPPVDAFAVGGIDNRSKNKRGTLCYVPKCNNFGGHKFPSEATAKNAWIK